MTWVTGNAPMALVAGNPGAPPPPPPFVSSLGIGCPHEKQTDVWPGVAIVIIPHDGHGILTMGGGPAPESGDDNGVVPGGGCAGVAKSACEGTATTAPPWPAA